MITEKDLKLLALKICYEMYIYLLVKSNNEKSINNCLTSKNNDFHTIRKYLKNNNLDIKQSKEFINFLDEKSNKNLNINKENIYIIEFSPSFCIIKFICFSFMIKLNFELENLRCTYNPLNKELILQKPGQKKYKEDIFFKKVPIKNLTSKQMENRMILFGFSQ